MHVLVFLSEIEQLRSDPLCHTGQPAHPLLACKVVHGILVLDDGALALWNAALPEVAVVDVEWLVHRVLPFEANKANHIKVLIALLKSTLQPRNLGRLTCGICDLIQNLVPLQAVFLDQP